MKKVHCLTILVFSFSLAQAASVAQVHSEQAVMPEEQIEGHPGALSVAEQLAARTARLAAERLQKENADKEQAEQRREDEPLAPANNGNVVEAQIEGANAEDRAVVFTSQMPGFLKPGQWDTFSGNDPEGITQIRLRIFASSSMIKAIH